MFSHDKDIKCEFKVVKKNSEYNSVWKDRIHLLQTLWQSL
jgi:hypothetical protein